MHLKGIVHPKNENYVMICYIPSLYDFISSPHTYFKELFLSIQWKPMGSKNTL